MRDGRYAAWHRERIRQARIVTRSGVKGGQGRAAEDVEGDAVAVLGMLAVAAVVALGAVLGVALYLWAR